MWGLPFWFIIGSSIMVTLVRSPCLSNPWTDSTQKILNSLKYLTIESKIAISTQNSREYFGLPLNYGMDVTSQLYF